MGDALHVGPLVIYTIQLRRVDEGAVVEWFVSFWDLETQRTSVRAGEASNGVDAMAQVIAAGRELARRDDGRWSIGLPTSVSEQSWRRWPGSTIHTSATKT